MNWVSLQRSASPLDRLYFSLVGLHALTLPQDPVKLRQERLDSLAALLAVGIDPRKSVIFCQDQVSLFNPKEQVPTKIQGPATCRARMDAQLHHSDGQTPTNDHVEGK